MAERGLAVGLVVLGGTLTAASCFTDLYTTYQQGPVAFRNWISLWGTRTDRPVGPEVDTVLNAGVPVVIAAALMVVAAVLVLSPRLPKVSRTARVTAVVAAGALAGIVLAFVVGVLQEEEFMGSLYGTPGHEYRTTYLPGLYLLVAGALAGLVGAMLTQWPHQPRPVGEPGREAVVVHRFTDDDTPPFGIAVPVETGEHRRD